MTARDLVTCLWLDGQAEQAAKFYTSIFPDGKLGRIVRRTAAGVGPEGSVLTVEFELRGQRFLGLNGGPEFTFNEAISFQILCDSQDEVDYYWNKLADGGQEVQCGWVKDVYGVAWQVVPTVLPELISDPDREKAKRVTEAMLTMTKIDIAALQKAHAGA